MNGDRRREKPLPVLFGVLRPADGPQAVDLVRPDRVEDSGLDDVQALALVVAL